jgi:DNA-binding beta-propeller fold protein YncE
MKKLMVIVFLIFWMVLQACQPENQKHDYHNDTLNAQSAQADKIYTTDADFEDGNLIFVNHDDPPGNDQLQLSKAKDDYPFVNVAAPRWNTLIRIDAVTGEIIGEYRTAPESCVNPGCIYPSRTTVDPFGNVWVSNRNESGLIDGVPHGSVVKIGVVIGGDRVNADGAPNPDGDYLAPPFEYSTCVDRDGDGLIKTSRGQGDVGPWPDITDGQGGIDGIVEDADDECILIYQRLPEAGNAHHVSVDGNNNVWVGGYPPKMFYKLDGDTGEILDSFDASQFGCGGFGGLIDGQGLLWSASPDEDRLLRYDPSARTGTCITVSGSSGLGVDTNGYIWNSMGANNSIAKISPDGGSQSEFLTEAAPGDFGVAVTLVDNNVWVANTDGNTVSRLDNNGNVLKTITVFNSPTGVAVDANGKVWVTNNNFQSYVTRIDPTSGSDIEPGEKDLWIPLNSAFYGPYPDNYNDMTGLVANGTTSPRGTWTVIHDLGGSPCTGGTTITWNSESEGAEPDDSSIIVEARASDSVAGLKDETFQEVSKGVALDNPVCQFIEVRATLRASSTGESPVLSDLNIASSGGTSEFVDVEKYCCVLPPPSPPAMDTCTKPIDELTMIWNGTQSVRVKAYKGDTTKELLADIDDIEPGNEVTVSGFAGSPNDVIWEIFYAGTDTLFGESTFHLSCSDGDMNGFEDCGTPQGNGKGKSGFINNWILEGILYAGGALDCTPDTADQTTSACVPQGYPEGTPCDSRLKEVGFEYTGDGCTLPLGNPQGGKAECTDFVLGDGPVNIEYTGKDPGKITVNPSNGINEGALFRVTATGRNKLHADTKLEIYDSDMSLMQSLKIHTSCSKPLQLGDVFGSLRVVEFTTKEGVTKSLADPEPPELTSECLIPAPPPPPHCTTKVEALTLRYLGGGCTDDNDQDKDDCCGDPGASPVSILITKDADKVSATPSNGIAKGDLITITHSGGKLRRDTKFDITGADGLTQSLKIHTSCSQPLNLGDRFGAFEVFAIDRKGQGPVSLGGTVEYQYVITNLNALVPVENLTVVDDQLGLIADDLSVPPNESISLFETTTISEDTVNIVTVSGEGSSQEILEVEASATVTVEEPLPVPDVCTSKVQAMLLRYTGPTILEATIEVDPDKGPNVVYTNVDLISDTTILSMPAENDFTIDAQPDKNELGAKTKIRINGIEEVIHTSCSTPFVAGAPAPLDKPKGDPSPNWFVEQYTQKLKKK